MGDSENQVAEHANIPVDVAQNNTVDNGTNQTTPVINTFNTVMLEGANSTMDSAQNNIQLDVTNKKAQDYVTNSSHAASNISDIMSSVNSCLNLIKPFSGESTKEQSLNCFFETLEDLATLAQWPPNIVHFVLLSKLTGKAAAFYEQNLRTLRGRQLSEIRYRFNKRFGISVESDPWHSIQNCKQAIGETVEEFASRMFELREKCNGMRTDSFLGMGRLLVLFLNSLTPTLKEHMVTLDPKTFGEAVQMAAGIESKLSKLTKHKSTAMMTAADYDDPETEEISHAISTLAVSIRENTNPEKKYKTSTTGNDKKTMNRKPNSETKYERSSRVTKKKNKEEREHHSQIAEADERSVFRDTSGTTMAELNRMFGGTKHLIQVHAGTEIIQSLVDPASDYTIISENTVERLGLTSKIYKGEKSSIAGALGGLIDSEACVDIIFKIGGKGDRFKHSFRLATSKQILGYNIIIGMDFLLPNKAHINYVTNTLYLWNKAVTQLIPTSKVQSSSNLLELVYNQSNDNNENSPNENDGRTILVQYLPDGTWKPLSELFTERTPNNTATLVGSNTTTARSHKNVMTPTDRNYRHKEKKAKENKQDEYSYLIPIQEGTHAVGTYRDKLIDLCKKHKNILLNADEKLRVLKNFSHTVELTDNTPIKRAQYQIPVTLRSDLKVKLQEYENNDILEPSSSPWNLPLIVKRKKNGELRLILDATAVNNVTRKIDYPIIRIEDTFHRLSKKNWFSNIDLKNGYHQIQLDSESRKYYAFKTPFGKYQFKRMPMGASNSGLFFQKVMEKILAPLDHEKLVIYQDDILIATDTIEEHLSILDQLFSIFEKENVQINGEKSMFMAKEITFLGHSLKRGNFSPSAENLTAIKLLQPPRTKKQLRGVLGKINFYGRFVPSLSQTALPLTNLLASKKKEIQWGQTEEEAFQKLKNELCVSPILHYPDFGRKFIVTIQVSDAAIVSALEQELEDGRWPLAYYSKKLNPVQRNYSVIEKHALAVITVLEYFHHIIHGYEVEVVTERKAIEYLRCLKDGSTRTTNWINLAAKYSPNYTFDNSSKAITQLLDIEDKCEDTVEEENMCSPITNSVTSDENEVKDIPIRRASKIPIATALKKLPEDKTQIAKKRSSPDTMSSNSVVNNTGSTADSPCAFTDGSCINNGTSTATAGIGVSWVNEYFPDYHGPCEGVLSNNKAELLAVIKAINTAISARLPRITICTDSSYIINNVTQNKKNWKTNGWLKARGKTINNITYFQEIDKLEDEIDITWIHVKGHSGNSGNDKAHALALKGCEEAVQLANSASSREPELMDAQSLAIHATPASLAIVITEEEIIALQKEDEECIRIREENINMCISPKWIPGIQCYRNKDNHVRVKGIVEISPRQSKRIDCLYVPSQVREKILNFIHLSKWSCHTNYANMCHTLLAKYFWSTFRVDIKQYIAKCPDCQSSSASRKKPVILDFPKPRSPGDKIAIDIIGPIITARGGEKYILTIIDLCSRYLTVCPLEDISTISVVRSMEKYYIAIFGTPNTIITDRGSNFRGKIFEESCKLMHIKHYLTAPYRPSTNGVVERANKEIKRKLTMLCNHAGDTWSDKLYLVQFAHNNSWHAGINSSPNKVTFGRNMSFPGWELRKEMEVQDDDIDQFITELRNRLDFIRTLSYEHEAKTRSARNERINKKRYIPNYKSGDLVMLRSIKKGKTRNEGFSFLYSGPYKIVKKVSDVSYDIVLPGNLEGQSNSIRTHAERLKPFVYVTDGGGNTITPTVVNELQDVPVRTEEPEKQIIEEGYLAPLEEVSESINDKIIEKEQTEAVKEDGQASPTEFEGRYFTRSKGKVDEELLKKIEIKRGRVIRTRI